MHQNRTSARWWDNPIYAGLVWSNSQAPEEAYIRSALLKPHFLVLLELVLELGLDRVNREWSLLADEGTPEAVRAKASVTRILTHIERGIANAQARNGKSLGVSQAI